MRKILGALALFLGVLFATETRVTTFGGVADFLKDDALALTYPSQILSFPGYLVLEAYDENTLISGNAYLKGYFGLGENHSKGVFGVYLNIPVYTYPYRTIKGFMLSYGKYLGEKLGFGLNFGFGNYSRTYEDTTGAGFKNKESAKIISLNPGITFYLSETDFIDAAFKFNIHSFDVKSAIPSDTTKAKGTSDISFDARYMRSLSEYTSLVVGFHFLTSDNSTEERAGGQTSEFTDKFSSFGLNIGINTQPIDVLNFILGFQITSASWDYGDAGKQGRFSFGAVTGLEADLGKYFLLRLAARKDLWGSYTDDYLSFPTGKLSLTTQDLLPLALGFAYKRGNLRVDAQASPDIFYNGPYFITGRPSNFFTSISILYSFSSY
ncbi:MAG: hypothetical protein ABIN15_06715 [candidate division WOR-3 bacterium]